MKKMRLLSFMQLAESNPEMTFELIQSELQINEEDVESFIIEGNIKTNLMSTHCHYTNHPKFIFF